MEEEEERRLESFLKWAAELGITDSTKNQQSQNATSHSCLGHSLKVSNFPDAGGRGLGAVRDLRKGEMILRVPKSALITSKTLSFNDHKLYLALNRHPSLSSTQRLTVCLLYEMGKGASSWWYPYLMHFPRSYHILATFGEFEKQALQVDDAIWTTEKAIAKAELEWKEANMLMKELKLKRQLLSFTAWLWASAAISSRTLHIHWDEAGCLCPVGDLFNYDAPDEATPSLQVSSLRNGESMDALDSEDQLAQSQRLTDGGFEEDVAAYCFYARKSYQEGEQVLLSYGTYTNLELLEHYGFFLNKNPNDKVFIPLEPKMYCSSSWPKESLYIHQDGKPSFALLSTLRLWATPQSQRRSVGHLAYSGSQLSMDNEISVMRWISKNCHLILKNFPSSIKEDSFLLSAIDEIPNSCTALELRNMMSTLGGEGCNFLRAIGMLNRESAANLHLSKKARSSIERWKLAVQWRLWYKKSLVDCIDYCGTVTKLFQS
ncbi:SET domain-containing protein/Rubis-subs-bind domain-containing protein [Cephalotus follicularis]|uniref:SET domain-containing protein/Rubis-subs-bind domain-containing protein n=1 Tax=Cephalotus follicularis TaxID=3775 RepID=A0A1Q3B175_CEPFO|nr:SET domain-containing protein/Rubis-subs-bind domain-containing protein [Cephalotus follicularis]